MFTAMALLQHDIFYQNTFSDPCLTHIFLFSSPYQLISDKMSIIIKVKTANTEG